MRLPRAVREDWARLAAPTPRPTLFELTSEIAFVPALGAGTEVAWREIDERDVVALH